MKTTFSYNADAQHAMVYSRRGDGTVLCDVKDVPFRVGNLLSRLAEEAYREGCEAGRRDALAVIAAHIEDLAQKPVL